MLTRRNLLQAMGSAAAVRRAVQPLARCPELFRGDQTVRRMVANLDIMPSVLDAAGVPIPADGDGRSFLPLLRDPNAPWRSELLYEYFWERNYPQTPTTHALRTDPMKYIRYHGVWDIDELYDLEKDPLEVNNLIASPQHRQTAASMNRRLFELLAETGGLNMPLYPDRGIQFNLRSGDKSRAADFPEELYRKPGK